MHRALFRQFPRILLVSAGLLPASGCFFSKTNDGDQAALSKSGSIGSAGLRSVGGATTGLAGTLVLANNRADALTLTADGAFAFAGRLREGDAYSVEVARQPEGQTCSVTEGTGTVGKGDVSSIRVVCNPFFITGKSPMIRSRWAPLPTVA